MHLNLHSSKFRDNQNGSSAEFTAKCPSTVELKHGFGSGQMTSQSPAGSSLLTWILAFTQKCCNSCQLHLFSSFPWNEYSVLQYGTRWTRQRFACLHWFIILSFLTTNGDTGFSHYCTQKLTRFAITFYLHSTVGILKIRYDGLILFYEEGESEIMSKMCK